MHYVVLGSGGIGRALIADVLASDTSARITAIDQFDQALASAQQMADASRIRTAKLDVSDVDRLARELDGASVVVNATDGSRSIEILRACIQAHKPYLDVHGTLLVNERLALSDVAREAGITAFIGMGCSPGITNMLGGYGVRNAAGEITVDVEYITQRPLNPSMGLLDTVMRQFRDHVRSTVYDNGQPQLMPPFAGPIRTRFAGMDEDVELVLTPHSEPQTLPRFLPNVKRVTVRGGYQAEIMDLVRTLSRFGLLRADGKVDVGGEQRDFQPILRDALMGDGTLKPSGVQPIYFLRVRTTGMLDGVRTIREVTVGHPRGWDALPQARMTALPTSFTAQLIAHGKFHQPGVCGPEMFTDAQVEECLSYLRARGLWTVIDQRETRVLGDYDGAFPA